MSREQEKKLFDAITEIRNDLIEQAQDTKPKAARPKLKAWGVIAACAILVAGLGGAMVWRNLSPIVENAGSGGSGHEEGSTIFMSYAGPVFPLTMMEAQDEIIASRHISYDFSNASEDSFHERGAQVRDSYILSNNSEQERTVTVLYPFAGKFNELKRQQPTITVGGKEVRTVLRAGSYSGDFTGVYGADDPDGSANLRQINSWEGYKGLLEDGSYQRNALSPYPPLNQRVTVYEFSDYKAPLEQYQAATQAISFTIDRSKTTILQYGFEGTEWEDNGFERYSYFVPNGVSMRSESKLLIVIGEDIGDYALQGYKNGACEKGNELEEVSATVTRYEALLSDVVDRLITDYFEQYEDGGIPADVSREMFVGAMAQLLYQYGIFSDAVADRYQSGRLLDAISETNVLERVLYLEFQVTIPAGESVVVTADLHKSPSFDFTCSGSENVGLQGYDMVTRLGSNLHFEALTAEVMNTEHLEIVRQNYGFNLPGGVTTVTLDPDAEHYYLEIRPVKPWGTKPFKTLSPQEIASAEILLLPPDQTIPLSDLDKIAELCKILQELVIYRVDERGRETNGQLVQATIKLRGEKVHTIGAYGTFLFLDGTCYRTKYEPSERLNSFGNSLRNNK